MNRNRDKKSYWASLLRIVGTILSFGLVAFLILQNWDNFTKSLNRLSIASLLLLFVLAFSSRLIVSIRWFVILKVVEPNFTLGQALKLSFIGLFTTNFLPSTIGGDFIKLGGAIQSGLNAASVTGSLIIDRLIGMTTMAAFLPIGLIALPAEINFQGVLDATAPGVLFHQVWEKIKDYYLRVIKALKIWIKHPFQLFIAAGFSFFHMACIFTMVYLILQELNDPISWWISGGLWVLVYFVTLLPFSINGLGLQEASLSIVFTSFAGITESNSLVLAIVIRILFMIASLPGAFFLPKILSTDKILPRKFKG